MGRALNGQNAYFHSLGGGSSRLIAHFHQTRAPRPCEPRVAGLQTVADITAFIERGGAAALKDYNLSAQPDESLPIRLADPASPYPSATAVGLAMDDYRRAMAQPLPLDGLDAPDLGLRETQAAWVAAFQAELTRVTQEVYGRNRRNQRRIVAAAMAAAALAGVAVPAAAVLGATAAAGLAATAGLAGAGGMIALLAADHHRRGLALERLRHKVREQAMAIEALTRHRQDNLVALIDGLFAAAGHLRDDSVRGDLKARLDGHVRMIFALRMLLGGNRKCTRYHVRMLEMAREASSLQLRDKALMRRHRHAGGHINRSAPRLTGRLLALFGLVLPVAASAAALAIAEASLPALTAALAGAANLAFAGWAIIRLNRGIDVLLPADELARLCDEDAFGTLPGPADIPLETGFLRMIDRWLTRLVREEDKHH